MKVVRFDTKEYQYCYAGKNIDEIREHFLYNEGIEEEDIINETEIPVRAWDEKFINIWENNDYSKRPYKVSINDQIVGTGIHLIYTTDINF